jgi:hypothetical protein
MKTRPVAAQLFPTDTKPDEWRYIHRDANCSFSQFCEGESKNI